MKIYALMILSFLLYFSSAILINQQGNQIPDDFLQGSKLISSQHRQMLYKWIDYRDAKTAMLWRGTEHNFDWDNMHEHCDYRGSALVIIKTPEGYLFGGFVSQGIKNQSAGYLPDHDAFIFSLTKGTVHHQRNKTANCILHSDQYISFGGRPEGHWDDISLRWSCNVDYVSYADFGWTYSTPEDIIPGSQEAQTYFAGSYRWKCVDIEIWAVHREE